MATPIPIHYCDSNIFISFLNGPGDANHVQCKTLIEAATQGKIRMVTSAFSQTEVHYIKDSANADGSTQAYTPEQEEAAIQTLFSAAYIELVNYEREVAEISRFMCRQYKLTPVDSVHVSTAVRFKADFFNSTDAKLLRKIGTSTISLPPRYPKPTVLQPPCLPGETLSLF